MASIAALDSISSSTYTDWHGPAVRAIPVLHVRLSKEPNVISSDDGGATEGITRPGRSPMSKPVQIATASNRVNGEQFGRTELFVLCDDGSIYQICDPENVWRKVDGPWLKEVPNERG